MISLPAVWLSAVKKEKKKNCILKEQAKEQSTKDPPPPPPAIQDEIIAGRDTDTTLFSLWSISRTVRKHYFVKPQCRNKQK